MVVEFDDPVAVVVTGCFTAVLVFVEGEGDCVVVVVVVIIVEEGRGGGVGDGLLGSSKLPPDNSRQFVSNETFCKKSLGRLNSARSVAITEDLSQSS